MPSPRASHLFTVSTTFAALEPGASLPYSSRSISLMSVAVYIMTAPRAWLTVWWVCAYNHYLIYARSFLLGLRRRGQGDVARCTGTCTTAGRYGEYPTCTCRTTQSCQSRSIAQNNEKIDPAMPRMITPAMMVAT